MFVDEFWLAQKTVALQKQPDSFWASKILIHWRVNAVGKRAEVESLVGVFRLENHSVPVENRRSVAKLLN